MSSNDQRTMGLRERKKAKTMAAIQMHALRLFREKGYNETTVEQIAAEAEVSPSTFFRYFPTKEDVVIKDDYDPLLVAAFEAQPPGLSLVEVIRQAVQAALTEVTAEELELLRERNRLIMTVPELRGAAMSNMTQTMKLIAVLAAKRTGRSADDFAIQTFAGAFIGVSISTMFYHAAHPGTDLIRLLDESLASLETGLTLQ